MNVIIGTYTTYIIVRWDKVVILRFAATLSNMPGRKYQRWSATIFNMEEEDAFKTATSYYYIIGKETCPDTGAQHLQCYIELKTGKTLHWWKQRCPTTHFEPSFGTAEENTDYCMKDGDFEVEGNPRVIPKQKKKDWKTIINKAEEGDLDWIKENDPAIYAMRYFALKDISLLLQMVYGLMSFSTMLLCL